MDPRLACFIFTSLAGRTDENGQLLSTLAKLNRAEFEELQNYALKFVYRVELQGEVEIPIPVINVAGLLVDSHLEFDPKNVMRLTTDSLMFNLQPFLAESKSTEVVSNH
jgi:hypothetical protein